MESFALPHGSVVKNSGDTYSHAFGTTIGSESLTTVFGMGTGVTFQICSPENIVSLLSQRKCSILDDSDDCQKKGSW